MDTFTSGITSSSEQKSPFKPTLVRTKEEQKKAARSRELKVKALGAVVTGLEIIRDTAFIINPIFWPFVLSSCAPDNNDDKKNKPSNKAPVVDAPFTSVSIPEDGTASVALAGHFTDPEGQALTYSALGFTTNIQIQQNGDFLKVYPAMNFNGTETGMVEACDPKGLCAQSPLTVSITPVNDRPVVSAPFANVSIPEDSTTSIALNGHFLDVEGGILTYKAIGFGTSISALISGNTLNVSAAQNFNGTQVGQIWACDAEGLCASTPLTLTFTPVNDAPQIKAAFPDFSIPEDAFEAFLPGDYFKDPDGDTLTYQYTGFGPFIFISDYIYGLKKITSTPDYNGSVTGLVKACDPSGLCVQTSLKATFTPINEYPRISSVFNNVSIPQNSSTSVALTGHFTEPDGQALTYHAYNFGVNVSAVVSGNNVNISSIPNYTGSVTGLIEACDPTPYCVQTPLKVTFTLPNQAPVVSTPFSSISIPMNTSMTVPLAGHFADPEGKALTYSLSGFSYVTPFFSGDSLVVFSVPYFAGSETGQVKACDPEGLCAQTPLKVSFTGPNDIVTVSGRNILVNGKEYIIKGVGYHPNPIGTSADQAPYGDYFTLNYKAIYERDIALLKEMHVNTIRIWGMTPEADHTDFFNQLNAAGIKAIVGIWVAPGRACDPAYQEEIKQDFLTMINNNMDHNAVLMWAFGNEVTYQNQSQCNPEWYAFINTVAGEAHALEGPNYHPVATVNLASDLIPQSQSVAEIASYNSAMPNVDVIGYNAYFRIQGKSGPYLSQFFLDSSAASAKPMFVGEFGVDAFNTITGMEDEATQSYYNLALWNEIAAARGVCSGGVLMEYSDEWWKGKYFSAPHPGCPDPNFSVQSACGYYTPAQPDGSSNEESYGAVKVKKNGTSADIVTPRQTYFTMGEAFSRITE